MPPAGHWLRVKAEDSLNRPFCLQQREAFLITERSIPTPDRSEMAATIEANFAEALEKLKTTCRISIRPIMARTCRRTKKPTRTTRSGTIEGRPPSVHRHSRNQTLLIKRGSMWVDPRKMERPRDAGLFHGGIGHISTV